MHVFEKVKKYLPFVTIFFAAIFSIVYEGYYFGQNDHAVYVPYIKSLADTSLYHRDIMVQTWKAAYFGNLWRILALFLPVIPLQPLFFLLHVFFRILFFLALYLVMKELSKNTSAALLAIVLWTIPKPSLGFEVFYNQFVQSEIGTPLLLFASYFFFEKKYIPAAVLLAITFHFHPPMAGFIAVCFFISLLWQKLYTRLLQTMAIIFTIALPILLPTLLFTENRTGYDTAWITLTKLRSPGHSFPLLWSFTTVWFPYAVFLIISVLSLFLIYKKLAGPRKQIILFLIPMFSIMFAGFVFSEIIPVGKIIAMVPFHISPLASIFLSLPTIYCVFLGLTHKNIRVRSLTILFFLFYFFSNFNFIFGKAEIFLIFISSVTYLFLETIKGKHIRTFLVPIFLGIFFLYLVVFWIPIAAHKTIMRRDPFTKDWFATQVWAKNHTGKNDLFLVPIYIDGFQVFSERSIVADWKDGTIGFLSPEYLKEWWRRMEEFGLTKSHYDDPYQKKMYQQLSEKKVLSLARYYRVQYFVTETNRKTYSLKKVYGNQHFIVYKL